MRTRAIGYGRKSFDDPENRTSSVDDQELFARNYAAQHDFEFVEFYGDNGVTGATMERIGLQTALAALKAGEAQILIIEDVDRLGRDQEHLSYMRKLFAAYNVTVHTVAAGRLDDLVFSFKGIIGEQQRLRIAYTTRRGLKAKATRGGATGGKILGYQKEVTGLDAQGRQTDRLAICPEEAELVRRIFELYAEGRSLKAICQVLNDEGTLSPRARESGKYNAGIWNPSTLSGNVEFGEGILNNQTYTVVRLPANYDSVYRSAIAELEDHLRSKDGAPSREAIRALIERVIVHSGDSRSGKVRRLELHGDLYRMLEFTDEMASGGGQKRRQPQAKGHGAASVTPVVAGVGFEPTTFRL